MMAEIIEWKLIVKALDQWHVLTDCRIEKFVFSYSREYRHSFEATQFEQHAWIVV